MSRPASLPEAAVSYAENGHAVFPLQPGGKAPLIPTAHPQGDPLAGLCKGACGREGHGVYDATLDPAQVRAWWRRHPEANIGIRTGHRFDVLDVDSPTAARALRELLGATGGKELAGGPLVRTARGWHYYLKPAGVGCPPVRGVAGLDWRGHGGAVVAPPSRHPSGRVYRWVRGLWQPLPAAPERLQERLQPLAPQPPGRRVEREERTDARDHPYGRAALDRECDQLAKMPPDSGRNTALYTASLRLFSLAKGGVLDSGEVHNRLLAAAKSAGLPEREALTALRSGQQRVKYPRSVPDLAQSTVVRPRQPRPRARDGHHEQREDAHARTR